MAEMQRVAAIDFGTANLRVAVLEADGGISVLLGESGASSTPACVAFPAGGKKLVGHAASFDVLKDVKNTVHNVKRVLGRTYHSVCAEKCLSLGSAVECDRGRDAPRFLLKGPDGAPLRVTPEEVSAAMLQHLGGLVQRHLGTSTSSGQRVVIAVPAFFNSAQRQAVKDAARMSGLELLSLINETSATALTYACQVKGRRLALIVDIGAGGGCVSLVRTLGGGHVKVLATSGQNICSGDDFNAKMMDHFAAVIWESHKKNLYSEPQAQALVRSAWEKAKRQLTKDLSVELDVYLPGIDVIFTCQINRMTFEGKCWDLTLKLTCSLQEVLQDAQVSRADIDDVVLVGGASCTPMVRSTLDSVLGQKDMVSLVSREEAVVIGATLYAAVLAGVAPFCSRLSLEEVMPLQVTVQDAGSGRIAASIDRNAPLPYLRTVFADQKASTTFQVEQGCNYLSTLAYVHVIGKPDSHPPSFSLKVGKDGIVSCQQNDGYKMEVKSVSSLSEGEVEMLSRKCQDNNQDASPEDPCMEARSSLKDFCLHLLEGELNAKNPRSPLACLLRTTLEWCNESDNSTEVEFKERLDMIKLFASRSSESNSRCISSKLPTSTSPSKDVADDGAGAGAAATRVDGDESRDADGNRGGAALALPASTAKPVYPHRTPPPSSGSEPQKPMSTSSAECQETPRKAYPSELKEVQPGASPGQEAARVARRAQAESRSRPWRSPSVERKKRRSRSSSIDREVCPGSPKANSTLRRSPSLHQIVNWRSPSYEAVNDEEIVPARAEAPEGTCSRRDEKSCDGPCQRVGDAESQVHVERGEPSAQATCMDDTCPNNPEITEKEANGDTVMSLVPVDSADTTDCTPETAAPAEVTESLRGSPEDHANKSNQVDSKSSVPSGCESNSQQPDETRERRRSFSLLPNGFSVADSASVGKPAPVCDSPVDCDCPEHAASGSQVSCLAAHPSCSAQHQEKDVVQPNLLQDSPHVTTPEEGTHLQEAAGGSSILACQPPQGDPDPGSAGDTPQPGAPCMETHSPMSHEPPTPTPTAKKVVELLMGYLQMYTLAPRCSCSCPSSLSSAVAAGLDSFPDPALAQRLLERQDEVLQCMASATLHGVMREVRDAGRVSLLLDTLVTSRSEVVRLALRYCQLGGTVVERVIGVEGAAAVTGQVLLQRVAELFQLHGVPLAEALVAVGMDAARTTKAAYGELLGLLRERAPHAKLMWNSAHRVHDLLAQAWEDTAAGRDFCGVIWCLKEFFCEPRRSAGLVALVGRDADAFLKEGKLTDVVGLLYRHLPAVRDALAQLKEADGKTAFLAKSLMSAIVDTEFVSLLVFAYDLFREISCLSSALTFSEPCKISKITKKALALPEKLNDEFLQSTLKKAESLGLPKCSTQTHNFLLGTLRKLAKATTDMLIPRLSNSRDLMRDIDVLALAVSSGNIDYYKERFFGSVRNLNRAALEEELEQRKAALMELPAEARASPGATVRAVTQQLTRRLYRHIYPNMYAGLLHLSTAPLLPAPNPLPLPLPRDKEAEPEAVCVLRSVSDSDTARYCQLYDFEDAFKLLCEKCDLLAKDAQ